ncbi:conserved Plasmodium protein, unknown function [Plasmodium malariae]|uniref:Uncharacterized protein n=1 Tax=Plasmodium malariae TaxID=5858 RepID=A0A1C3KYW2_PLAMA|nr:conserved Plasmodium protein, unknown function [Plasmodium malariae]SBT79365.1 conserved Plasmodium protein, unknown function [Plasmodium malariae]SCN12327.1 conserved Plasmodium protein, unknown function [Plasmodium malariae]
MSMFLNILILLDAASVAFLSITFLMINLNEESLLLSKAHRENGKKALVAAILLYAVFLVLLFIYRAYKNKRKLYNNFFMKNRNAPKYVQLSSTYFSASDDYEQYELSKI